MANINYVKRRIINLILYKMFWKQALLANFVLW